MKLILALFLALSVGLSAAEHRMGWKSIDVSRISDTIVAFAACNQQTANANPKHDKTMNEAKSIVCRELAYGNRILNISDRDVELFFSKVEKTKGCWLWIGRRDDENYGNMRIGRRSVDPTARAHRISYTLFNGLISRDLPCVLHRCDNPPCVNPDHLFLGTQQDNIEDKTKKGRCASGDRNGRRLHPETTPKGEEHGAARLTDDLVYWIRSRPMSLQGMARKLGVNKATVNDVIQKRTWKHIA